MKMSLSFSIDRILSSSEERNKQLPKISLYADKSNVPTTSYGTEALDSRLSQTISSKLFHCNNYLLIYIKTVVLVDIYYLQSSKL